LSGTEEAIPQLRERLYGRIFQVQIRGVRFGSCTPFYDTENLVSGLQRRRPPAFADRRTLGIMQIEQVMRRMKK
jgi:hypothetical protein